LLTWLAPACLAALLVGCEDEPGGVAESVSGYNHMSGDGWHIGGFSVNGASGPNLQPRTGGEGFHCCILIPERWMPGMKAKVAWWYDVKAGDSRIPPPPQEAEVEIPDYNAMGPGTVAVHFYPEHRVKLVVSNYIIEYARYPMSAEDKLPWRTDSSFARN